MPTALGGVHVRAVALEALTQGGDHRTEALAGGAVEDVQHLVQVGLQAGLVDRDRRAVGEQRRGGGSQVQIHEPLTEQ